MERFKKYYESLMNALHLVNTQLQQSTSSDLSPDLIAQLQEKRREIKSNLSIFLSKLQTQTQKTDPIAGVRQRQTTLDALMQASIAHQGSACALGAEARQFLCQVGDRFIGNVLYQSLMAARVRGAQSVSAKDVAFVLERGFDIQEPAASNRSSSGKKGSPLAMTEGHKLRMNQVKRFSNAFSVGTRMPE